MLRILARVTRLYLASLLALTACASSPSAPPPDAAPVADAPDAQALDAEATDAAPEAAVDVSSPDAHPDVAAPDVTPPDAPTPDAAEVALDVAPDAAPEAAVDAAPDRPEVADVTPADVAPPCVEGAVRCADTRTAETCRASVWVRTTCRGFSSAINTTEECYLGACFDCSTPVAGSACSFDPPLCDTDEACYRNGRGRCVAGRCARRGPVECRVGDDCLVWLAAGIAPGCGETTINGRTLMACSTSSARACTVDANCPAAFRCDTATGLCARR